MIHVQGEKNEPAAQSINLSHLLTCPGARRWRYAARGAVIESRLRVELDRALAVIIINLLCLNIGQAAAGPAGLASTPLSYCGWPYQVIGIVVTSNKNKYFTK